VNLLEAQGISVMRDGRRLLSDTSLQLRSGELHALLGPNGAGKSTLLHVLSGEWAISKGTITLGGRALGSLSAADQARRRAVLPQHDALSFGFTVREMVGLGRYAAADQRPAHQRQILKAVMEATDVTHLAERRYPSLSGGERRRAQLARVLAQVWDVPHAVLLLDEPMHSLDLAHQHAMLALLRALAERGFAVLASLHELNLAARYAHHISLMHPGQLLLSGTPEQVLDEPQLQALYGSGLRFTAINEDGQRQWLTGWRDR